MVRSIRRCLVVVAVIYLVPLSSTGNEVPPLDSTRYHSWEETEAYLDAIAHSPDLREIVKLIPIGYTREGKCLKVLQISRSGDHEEHPNRKPATFIMGAHHAREHVSKEAVLVLIDRILNGYGGQDPEGRAITYLVDAGTFYLLPWVNPDGGTTAYLHNSFQRKTTSFADEPQIGAADCDTCGDGSQDEDGPDLLTGDVGDVSRLGVQIAFADNGVISRQIQGWYENGDYSYPVVDARAMRVQPEGSYYIYNYEGTDPDGDGAYSAYSGEDFIGGVDANRNYGEPRWGDCAGSDGCSWISGSVFYAGPEPFSEPETRAVAAFLRSHPNIVTLESLHSGVTKVYPPDWILPDDPELGTMDQRYQDAVAQYISLETGYEVDYVQPVDSKGSTISYSYFGSSQDPGLALEFFPGGILSFVTEIYGMGNAAGSAEAISDWFPYHHQDFDTSNPQGLFVAWPDFPYCTTCDPGQMPGPLDPWAYWRFFEYFVFNSAGQCGGATDPEMFHCDYWGLFGNISYYADKDLFVATNPPAANRCYLDWNCTGAELDRTTGLQVKHLLYRLYIAPFIRVKAEETTFDGDTLHVAVENTGLLRSSIMTSARIGEDPFASRYNDHGQVDVRLWRPSGFVAQGPHKVSIGWLGGGHPEDPEPRTKTAAYAVKRLDLGDTFFVTAASDKTGRITAQLRVSAGGADPADYRFEVVWTDYEARDASVATYFGGAEEKAAAQMRASSRTVDEINREIEDERARIRTRPGRLVPFDLVPGHAKAIRVEDPR